MTAAAPSAPIRVLLVEDNPGDTRLILEMLREAGEGHFELERVERLEHAFERLEGSGADVVLLDLGLPDSQGIETFHRAHEPVIQHAIERKHSEGAASLTNRGSR